MKELIYISTTVGERLEEVLKIVGETLVQVFDPISEMDDEALVKISATDEEWMRIRTQLVTR